MNSYFQPMSSPDEQKFVINFLQKHKNDQNKSQDFDKYWHTTRMLQSLAYLVVDKRIFCDNKNNMKIIICNYNTQRTKLIECLEVWTNNMTKIELELLSENLLEIINGFVQEDKIVIIRSITNQLAFNLRNLLPQYKINIVYNTYLYCKLLKNSINFSSNMKIGFEIRQIPAENVNMILKSWKYGNKLDEEWLTRSIKNRPCVGIWDCNTNKMVGHFIFTIKGTFGMLYVNEKYRGLGLAKILTQNLSNIIRQAQMEFLIEIEHDNLESQNLFTKLHFEKLTESNTFVFDKIGNHPIPGKDF